MHTVLHLQSNGSYPHEDQALEQTLGETGLGCRLAHDHRSELAMIPHQYNLFRTHGERNERFGLHRLRRFVHEDGTEAEILEARIARTGTRAADHVGRLEDLPLGANLDGAILFLIPIGQFSNFILEAFEFLEFIPGG